VTLIRITVILETKNKNGGLTGLLLLQGVLHCIIRLVRKNMSSTASGVSPSNCDICARCNASPVNLSSAIVDLNHVLRRSRIENVRSADAVVPGKVFRTLSSEIQRNVTHWRFFLLYDQGRARS